MSNVVRFTPPGGFSAEDFIRDFLVRFKGDIDAVAVVALSKDGEIISGWSKECHEKAFLVLGMLENFKNEFWYACFDRRSDFS